jgi:hypothetical protein
MALAQNDSAGGANACSCSVGQCHGWESVSEDRWPVQHLKQVATLQDLEVGDPTYLEYHPLGTRYESNNAPVALQFFPYNRCVLWKCDICQRHLLRYTEFGGYYVDYRTRVIEIALVVD